MTPPQAKAPERWARLDEACDRVLVACALALLPVLALALWFLIVRAGGLESPLLFPLTLTAAVVAFLILRRRLYALVSSRRLLGLACGLCLALGGIELCANLVDPGGYLYYADCQRYFAWQRYDSGILPSHTHPASSEVGVRWGTIRTNDEGWRDPQRSKTPPPGTARVLALGDSVVFGWGVPRAQSLCPQVESALAQRLGRPAEVLNTGNGSYDSLDELLVLRERGLAYRPHAAFVLVLGNDFGRAPYQDQLEYLAANSPLDPALISTLRANAIARPPAQGPEGALGSLYSGVSYMLNRSFLISTGVRLAHGTLRLRRAPAPHVAPVDKASAPPPDFPHLETHTAALREIARVCRANEIPLTAFVFTPASTPLWWHIQRELSPLCRVVALEFPADKDARDLQLSATDLHWNAAGTEWFAGQIAKSLAPTIPR